VDEPVISASESASENAIAWMVLYSDDPSFDVQSLFDAADKRIKPYLERVSGLSQVNIIGGREREVHVEVDPMKMAQRGVTFDKLREALQRENVNVSAGTLAEGRLDLRVRTVGQYDNLEDVRQTIVAYTEGGPVRVQDVAEVELTFAKRRGFVHTRGRQALAINVIRETGSNVIEVMQQLRERIAVVNRDILPEMGGGVVLHLDQVYDETVYIYDAIDLVINNLWQGGALAVLILLLFLRSFMPTMIISLAIPISVIGTFVAMTAFGRNINVISLAGLAFAIGMVVDNAIVVLENIDRHLGLGSTPRRAAYDAAQEVWGAILASTLTTLVVFIPVLTVQEEAGQLFRDIALAICAAVGLSLVVSITVIPTAGARWIKAKEAKRSAESSSGWANLWGIVGWMDALTVRLADVVHWLIGRSRVRLAMRLLVVGVFTVGSLGLSWLLMPPTSYLPKGNRNLVFGIMFTPPSYNVEHNETIGERIESRLRPYWEAKTMADTAKLPPVMGFMARQPIEVPPIENYFYVSFGGTIFMGASSMDKEVVEPLGPLLTSAMFGMPGSFGFAEQSSLFGRGGGGGLNSVDVEITAADLGVLRSSAGAMYQRLAEMFGYDKVRPDPMNFNLPGPELQVGIDRVRAANVGMNVKDLGLTVQAMIDGVKVGDYRLGGDSIDLVMVRPEDRFFTAEGLAETPLAVRLDDGSFRVVPLSSVADIQRTTSPQKINRIEQLRSIKFTVVPRVDMPLEEATQKIAGLVEPMKKEGSLAPGCEVALAGTADKLTEVREAMLGQWHGWTWESFKSLAGSRLSLALLITYLLMAALFESYLYPFVIMFSVPFAAVGGFAGLALVHAWEPSQHLDVLTMLGFVILIGIVVNNAILLVHQAIHFMKGLGLGSGDKTGRLSPREAIRESVRTRVKPIMMTMLTTLVGMLPLVVIPGSGSELYRGLGAVILGGLLVSTMFTLVMVPLVFSMTLDAKLLLYRRLGWRVGEIDFLEAS
jgi:HAE1 family hydrophobic/amphiphilic exporter-1